jgi:cbb3-type cytochrome oxidase subunit 3
VVNFLSQTYTIALPIILTSLMGYIVWLLKRQKNDRDANSRGTMLLLRVQLIEYHDKYMKLGEIPSYAYQNFQEMYDAYHQLGGNGMVTKMKNEIEELHLKQKGVSNE